MNRLNDEQFIEKCRKLHGNRYDYSDTKYNGTHSKVTIICPIHGPFQQTPVKHINQKTKCPQCSIQQASENKIQYYSNIFESRANYIHNNKYSYNQVEYLNAHQKVIIECPIHGEFEQTPYGHLNGNGCPQCGSIGVFTQQIFERHQELKTIPSSFYCIKLHNIKEQFLKVGITTRNINHRIQEINRKTKYTCQQVIVDFQHDLYFNFCLEQSILQHLAIYKFVPTNKFEGYTECFENSQQLVELINQIVDDIREST